MIQQIKLILEQIKGVPGLAAQLDDCADIIEDIGLDSLQMMEFMLEVESQLDLEIDFEKLDFSYLKSIEKFSEVLEQMKKPTTAPSIF
jgi:acyl carrier protein